MLRDGGLPEPPARWHVRLQPWLALTVCCLFYAGCQGPRPAQPVLSRPVLGLEPPAATVTAGRTQRFTCSVSGGPGEVVVWRVLEPTGGSVDASGQYRAPAAPGVYTVQAGLRSGPPTVRAKVTVVAAPSGPIAAPARVTRGATGLVASVPDQAGASYAWTVQGGRLLEGAGTASVHFEAGSGPKGGAATPLWNEVPLRDVASSRRCLAGCRGRR